MNNSKKVAVGIREEPTLTSVADEAYEKAIRGGRVKMINRPKLKMVTDISKRLFYQYVWINVFLIWGNIKRSVVVIAEKFKKDKG